MNYEAIYETIRNIDPRVRYITPSGLAHKLGVERIYPGTMAKLVRDGVLEHAPCKGYYYIVGREEVCKHG